MKDLGIGLIGLTLDEFYSMTLGNFTRRSLGYIKNQWATQREVISAIINQWSEDKVTGEMIFPFGQDKKKQPPTEADRAYMRKRHERTKEILNG